MKLNNAYAIKIKSIRSNLIQKPSKNFPNKNTPRLVNAIMLTKPPQ